MRWKLKDLLAESVHPVPEKAVLAYFRHAKTTRSVEKNQNKTKQKLKCCTKTKIVKQKMNIVTQRWFTKEAGTRDQASVTTEKHVRPQTFCPDLWLSSWCHIFLSFWSSPGSQTMHCSQLIRNYFSRKYQEINHSITLNKEIIQIKELNFWFLLKSV